MKVIINCRAPRRGLPETVSIQTDNEIETHESMIGPIHVKFETPPTIQILLRYEAAGALFTRELASVVVNDAAEFVRGWRDAEKEDREFDRREAEAAFLTTSIMGQGYDYWHGYYKRTDWA